jgi:BirA family biotin operon repressor/biotin-[acetyl-CoA-carboxylase] ligase
MPMPSLPPAFHLIALDREVAAFQRAVRAAPRGIDDGTVYWTDRTDRLELAIVLEPETPVRRALEAVYVLTVAAGEALTRLMPPQVSVAFAWPGDLIVDGAKVGTIQVALAPVAGLTATPPWLVLGLALRLPQPGEAEGARALTVVQLVESIASHLLRWFGRWRAGGLDPVRSAWNNRCFRRGEVGRLELGGRRLEGRVDGLAADGDLVVGGSRLQLADAMVMPG